MRFLALAERKRIIEPERSVVWDGASHSQLAPLVLFQLSLAFPASGFHSLLGQILASASYILSCSTTHLRLNSSSYSSKANGEVIRVDFIFNFTWVFLLSVVSF